MPRTIRTGDVGILIAAAAAMVVLMTASFLLEPPANDRARASSYSNAPDGAKAAYLLLERLGYRVERSSEPAVVAAGRLDPVRTVYIIASPALKRSAQDVRALRRFVEAGGVLLTTGTGGDFVQEKGDAAMALKLPDQKLQTYPAAIVSPLTMGVASVQMLPEAYVFSGATWSLTLYGGASTGATLTPLGTGRAIWWVGSSPLLNDAIAKPGHVDLLLNMLGPPGARTVVWDEYYHGYGRGFGSFVRDTPLPAAFGHLALLAGLALFTFSRRRGPIVAAPVESRASAMEFVDAVGGLYRKARAASGAVEIVRGRVRRLLVTHLHLPSGAPDDVVARAAAARYGLDEEDLRTLLAESAAAAETANLPGPKALAIVQRLQATAARVLNASARAD